MERGGPAGRLDFRVLGPLLVSRDGVALRLQQAKPRAVLAVLLLSCNRPVHRDAIVRAVWGDNPPATAANVVQRYVTDLRSILDPDRRPRDRSGRIASVADRYLLRATEDELDLLRFRRLARAGRQAAGSGDAAAAVRALAAGLDLWRDRCLCDVDLAVTGYPELVALGEEWLGTVTDLAAVANRLGRDEVALPHLRRAAEQEPLREPVQAALMVALAAVGRQAEAIEVFQATRQRLGDELGVDPSEVLRSAYRGVLRQEVSTHPAPAADRPPERAVPAPPPAQLPAAVSGFTGREEQLARLDALVAGVDGGTGPAAPVALIAGGAGVGKTALAIHWGHRMADRFPDGQLYLDLSAGRPGAPPAAALAGLLRALGLPPEQIPDDLPGLAGLYRSALARRRMLVVLDNAATPAQVRPLLPGTPGCLAVVTSRRRLTGLVARDGACRVDLDVLSPPEALALLAELLGRPRVAAERSAAARLGRLCAHLPLALRIAAARLLDQPQRPIADYADQLAAGDRLSALRLDEDEPVTVRAAFDLSYQELNPPSRQLFQLLGLAPGGALSTAAVAVLAATELPEAAKLLDRLAAAHLIEARATDRYGFHDLLRSYAAERAGQLPEPDRTAARDRLAGWYLGGVDRAARLLYPQMAQPPQDRRPPMPAPAIDTPAGAWSWLDTERANLLALAGNGRAEPAWRLAAGLRGYFWLRRHTRDWLEIATAAAATVERADPPVRAAVRLSLGDAYQCLGRYDEAIRQYRAALPVARAGGWAEGEAAILGNLGNAHAERGELPRAAVRHRAALAIRRRTGSTAGVGITLGNLANVQFRQGQLAQAAETMAASLAAYQRTGLPLRGGYARNGLGVTFVHFGRFEDADANLAQALATFQQAGDRYGQGITLDSLAGLRLAAGRYPEALRLAQRALAAARQAGDHQLQGAVLRGLGIIRSRLGHHRTALAHLRHAYQLAGAVGARYQLVSTLVGQAEAELAQGRIEPAAATADRAREAARRSHYRLLEADATGLLAAVELAHGRPAAAAELAREAIALHRRTGHRVGQARAVALLGAAVKQVGEPAGRLAWRRAARRVADLAIPEAAQLRRMLAG